MSYKLDIAIVAAIIAIVSIIVVFITSNENVEAQSDGYKIIDRTSFCGTEGQDSDSCIHVADTRIYDVGQKDLKQFGIDPSDRFASYDKQMSKILETINYINRNGGTHTDSLRFYQ